MSEKTFEPNANQATVISALRRHEVPTISELAEYTRLSTSQVRTALKGLEKVGLAEPRGYAMAGGRTWTLTEQGL